MGIQYEPEGQVLVPEPVSSSGVSLAELELNFPAASWTSKFIDSALMEIPSRIKTLVIVVRTAITSAAPQQATVQLWAARSIYATLAPPATPFLGGQGAASLFAALTGMNIAQAVGPAVNLGGSVASIPVGIYYFSATWPGNPSASPPTSMTELLMPYPALGVEIAAPAAFTAGAADAYFCLAPN